MGDTLGIEDERCIGETAEEDARSRDNGTVSGEEGVQVGLVMAEGTREGAEFD